MTQQLKKYIRAQEENLNIFKALASKTRLNIIEILRNKELSITELSEELGLSTSIVTKHIKQLEKTDIVETYSEAGIHGLKKVCKIKTNEFQIILNNNYEEELKMMEIDIPIGSYNYFDVVAPCGMASEEQIIGILDDTRYFVSPKRMDSEIIWFTAGYLEYLIPIYEIEFDKLEEIEISLEICSEYPGYNNSFRSDIYFSLNEIRLGKWTSPGDFGDRKGINTPEWWTLGSQYGLLKMIRINENGVFLDGIQLSNVPLQEFVNQAEDSFKFKIECPQETEYPGGVNIFGRNFGNFDQDIKMKCFYRD